MSHQSVAAGSLKATKSPTSTAPIAADGTPSLERPTPRLLPMFWVLGMVFIGVAIAASGALVLKHFTGVQLPGCRAGSACDRLEQSIFGRILFPSGLAQSLGFAKWPISSVGLAYFAAIAAAWVLGFRWIAPGLKWMIRLGAFFSLVYVGVIVAKQEWCKYCIATHAANFSLLICMEVGLMKSNRSGRSVRTLSTPGTPGRRAGILSLAAFVLGFTATTGVLGFKEHGLAMAAEKERVESQERMIAKAREDAARAAAAAAAQAAQPGDEKYDFGPKGFTGRYRIGPEKAQVRIVFFGAYTCQFCKRLEQDALRIQAANPTTVSFSFKHYPMCWMCNKHITQKDTEEVHYNACWASRCAEACAIIAGANAELEGRDRWAAANEAFWRAHHWLYSIEGKFDDNSLMSGLRSIGFDADKVTGIMDKPAADKPVLADIEEAKALGLFQTPMIFINGEEFKGWQTPGAVDRTVAALLQANPPLPALDSSGDRPALAREKAIEDWKAEPSLVFMADTTPRSIGDPNAPVKVVLFGDYQEENTAKADKIIRAMISGPGGTAPDAASAKPIQYIFRHFPGDKTCNPKLPKTFFQHGCLAAKSAEAAAMLGGGDEAYWKMHAWLMDHQSGFGYDAAKRAAAGLGFNPDLFMSTLEKPEIARAIGNDIDAAEAVNVKQIPSIYIQGKWVRTWTREGDNVLARVVDRAAADAAKKPQ